MSAVRVSTIEKVRAAGRRYGREVGEALRLAAIRSDRCAHQHITRAAIRELWDTLLRVREADLSPALTAAYEQGCREGIREGLRSVEGAGCRTVDALQAA
jgi:hypothetical protein